MADDLDRLGKKIDEAQAKYQPPPEPDPTAMSNAMRLGTEFMSGIIVGCALGYFLDHLLDTGPIFLMVGLVLGLVAGYRNLTRAIARESQDKE